jgi:hypothetical protein
MIDARICMAAAAVVTAGVLAGCDSGSSCGQAAAGTMACAKGPDSSPALALPTFTEGVGMSEWLTYRGADVRALSYAPSRPRVSTRKYSRVDALEVEECAPLKHSVTVSHRYWTVAAAGGDRLGRLIGRLVDGRLAPDRPLRLSAGDCAMTTLAVALPMHAEPAAVHDGPDATWVLPGD